MKEERKAISYLASRADGLPEAYTGEIEVVGNRTAPENQDAVQKPNITTKAPKLQEQEHKRSRKEKEEPKARPEKSRKAS